MVVAVGVGVTEGADVPLDVPVFDCDAVGVTGAAAVRVVVELPVPLEVAELAGDEFAFELFVAVCDRAVGRVGETEAETDAEADTSTQVTLNVNDPTAPANPSTTMKYEPGGSVRISLEVESQPPASSLKSDDCVDPWLKSCSSVSKLAWLHTLNVTSEVERRKNANAASLPSGPMRSNWFGAPTVVPDKDCPQSIAKRADADGEDVGMLDGVLEGVQSLENTLFRASVITAMPF